MAAFETKVPSRELIASMLNYNPNDPDSWPDEKIAQLQNVWATQGERAAHIEIIKYLDKRWPRP